MRYNKLGQRSFIWSGSGKKGQSLDSVVWGQVEVGLVAKRMDASSRSEQRSFP